MVNFWSYYSASNRPNHRFSNWKSRFSPGGSWPILRWKYPCVFPLGLPELSHYSNAKLNPIQQSPALNSSARQFFCFFRRMTTYSRQSLLLFLSVWLHRLWIISAFWRFTLKKGNYRPVGSATDTANSPKATSLSMSLKDGMNFLSLLDDDHSRDCQSVWGKFYHSQDTYISAALSEFFHVYGLG